jgi:hypothetical protein
MLPVLVIACTVHAQTFSISRIPVVRYCLFHRVLAMKTFYIAHSSYNKAAWFVKTFVLRKKTGFLSKSSYDSLVCMFFSFFHYFSI